MKIGINFHTRDANLSGVEYYSLGLIRALVSYLPQNSYVVYTNRPDIVSAHAVGDGELSVRRVRYPDIRFCRILWEHLRLPDVAARGKLDVLHCPCYIAPVLGSKVPCVVTIHDTIAWDHPRWCRLANAAYYRAFMKATVRRVAEVVVVSRQTALDVQRCLGVDSRRLRVISPGVDPIFHKRMGADALREVRARYGLPAKYILHVGNLEPKKNLRSLLQAYDLLQNKRLPHGLVLVGKRCWKAGSTFRQVLCAKARHKIFLAGYVRREDLPGVYQMADAYVCPSLYEGFGFPPLEAMASGVPVLSSRRGALRETLADAAYEIDPESSAQIADATATVLEDRSIREKYADRGLVRSRMFSWRKTADELQALYSEIAAKG